MIPDIQANLPCDMSRKYKFHDPAGVYFISFATVEWIDVLTRPHYKDIIVESLRYCQNNKGLMLYEWVIMTNHVHLLAAAKEGYSMSDIMRDLKKFTSGRIHMAIKEHPGESRREWMLRSLMQAGIRNPQNASFQLWQQNNQPMQVTKLAEIDRVINYIRMNPVKDGIVDRPECFCYSSAYEPGKLKLDHV